MSTLASSKNCTPFEKYAHFVRKMWCTACDYHEGVAYGYVLMPRYFTLLEAEGYLPEVERLLSRLKEKKSDYEEADTELTRIGHRIHLMGGIVPPRDRVVELRNQKDGAARALKAAIEKMQQIGCQLKDLDMGLVDFPTLYKDREVYLCWKSGETGISFWHNVEDGYAGRKPIDREFLSNHKGDSPEDAS